MNKVRFLTVVVSAVSLVCVAVGCAGKTSATGGIVKDAPEPAPVAQAEKAVAAEVSPPAQVQRKASLVPKPEQPPAHSGAREVAPDEPVDLFAGVEPLNRIHFPFDDYTLTPAARETLTNNAQQLRLDQDTWIRIEGHCDERGTTEYNLALGEHRAVGAYEYLKDLGVSPERMIVLSLGEARPLDPRRNENAWALNRRADFVKVNH